MLVFEMVKGGFLFDSPLCPLLGEVFVEFVNFSLQCFTEILKSDNHHCDIIETTLSYRRFQDSLNSCATILMNGLAPVLKLLLRGFPASLDYLCVCQFVIDTIATKYYIVVIVLNLEALNVWCGNNDFRVSLIFGPFSLNVSKSSRDGQSAWKDSVRAKKYLFAHLPRLAVLILHFRNRLCLVYFAARCDYPLMLFFLVWFVVFGEGDGVFAT